MTKTDIFNDLDYIKTLAEEGRTTPLIGARVGLWWGILVCLTLFAHWMIITGKIDLPLQYLSFLWMGFAFVGACGSAWLGKSLGGKPGAASANNRVAHAIWSGNLVFFFVYGFSAGLSAAFGVNDYAIMGTMMPLAFGIYGLSAWVISKIGRERWMMAPALIAFAFVPLTLFMLPSPNLYLVAIVGIILTIIIPDVIHIRREPKSII